MTVKVFQADCIKQLAKLSNVDLLFADPPFNIGQDYPDYEDKLSDTMLAKFFQDWIFASYECLRKGGTAVFHVPDDLVPLVLQSTAAVGLRFKRVDWLIWHYRFGQAGDPAKSSKLINSKAHALVYVRSPKTDRTFNPPLVPSDRATKYNDRRTQATNNPGQRVAFDVWQFGDGWPSDIFGFPEDGQFWGRVQGNNLERIRNCPNQLPEVYLERIIRAYSNPGDLVVDPFGGSGTTAVVAQALGRDCVTMDVGKANVATIKRRLKKGAVRIQTTKENDVDH